MRRNLNLASLVDKARFAGTALRASMSGQSRLLTLGLCITNRCNIACLYCYGDYFHRRTGPKKLSLAEITSIVDQSVALGLRRLQLTGGEPLLHPDFGSIVEHARRHDLRVELTTNGYFLPREKKAMRDVALTVISLDGPLEMNDAVRGEGCYAAAMAAVDCCVEEGFAFSFKTVLNRTTLPGLRFMLDLAKRHGTTLETVFSYAAQSERQELEHGQLALDADEQRQIAADLRALAAAGEPLAFDAKVWGNQASFVARHPTDRVRRDQRLADFPYIECCAGRTYAFIDGDGRMFPCNQRLADFPGLNVLNDGVAAAFAHLAGHDCSACAAPWLNNLHLRSQPRYWLGGPRVE